MGRETFEGLEQELTRRYVEALDSNLVALAFFGSWARGEEKEWSDIDVLLIARDLPKHPFERNRLVYEPIESWRGKPRSISILARTVEEFTTDVMPLHLDLAADAIVFYDPEGFLASKLTRVQELIEEARLARERDSKGLLAWWWEEGAEPIPGQWAITWEGFKVGRR